MSEIAIDAEAQIELGISQEASETEPKTLNVNTLFYQDRDDSSLIDRLRQQKIIGEDEPILLASSDPVFEKAKGQVTQLPYTLRSRINPMGSKIMDPDTHGFKEITQLLPAGENAPRTVVIDIPTHLAYRGNHDAYQRLYIDFLTKIGVDNRPTVIMYSEEEELPLYAKHDYQGFMFASTPNELKKAMTFADSFAALSQKPADFRPEGLSPKQQEQYDSSGDLREWEHKTADTYQSLKQVISRIKMRNALYQKYTENRYEYPFKNVPRDPRSGRG